jgi:general secretion pathway protein N
LCGALLAGLLFAPARWLSEATSAATRGQVQLLTPRGTVWSGSANLVLTGGQDSQDRTALPGRLSWQLRPQWNGLKVSVSSDCCMPEPLNLRLMPGWGLVTVDMQDSQSQWPAGLLTGLGTPWNTVQATGQLNLNTQGLGLTLTQGRWQLKGSARLEARDISSRLSTLQPMGSYRIDIQGGDIPTMQLSTLEGSLLLKGEGQWVGSRLRFNGTAEAAPEREAALSNLLNIIGRRSGARTTITLG